MDTRSDTGFVYRKSRKCRVSGLERWRGEEIQVNGTDAQRSKHNNITHRPTAAKPGKFALKLGKIEYASILDWGRLGRVFESAANFDVCQTWSTDLNFRSDSQ
jgi:hypothetical protein